MINFIPGNEYRMCWFLAGDHQDYLAILFREPEGPWQLVYRFRYDGDTSTEDKRNWYAITTKHGTPSDKEKLISIVDGLCDMMVASGYIATTGRRWRVELTGDSDEVTRQFLALPFVHLKKVMKVERA